MKHPNKNDYPAYFENYLKNVDGENPIKNLEEQKIQLCNTLMPLTDEEANYSYAEGKWSIKEIIGHLIDTERVMSYRSMAIARGEKQHLPGFDQDEYAKGSNFKNRELSDILNEYQKVREATIALFKSFDESFYDKRGVANKSDVTVRAVIFMIPGHEMHHLKILKEKYLNKS
ncbi:MAG: DinB family protein [Ignavibacteriaceae bacterium]